MVPVPLWPKKRCTHHPPSLPPPSLPPRPQVVLYEKRGLKGRSKGATKAEYDMDDPELPQLIEADLWEQLQVGGRGMWVVWERPGEGAGGDSGSVRMRKVLGDELDREATPLLHSAGTHTPLIHTPRRRTLSCWRCWATSWTWRACGRAA